MKKRVITIIAAALLLCCAVGGTLAWLIDKTDPVVNTFTAGDVDIDLDETTKDYKMVPGNKIDKNPTVTVNGGSEACWLFVKVEKSANFDDFMTYEIDNTRWEPLPGVDGVYYYEVGETKAGESKAFPVLKDNRVLVKEDVTKAQLNALTEDTYPKLTFTAYAIQKDNIATAAEAWEKINA